MGDTREVLGNETDLTILFYCARVQLCTTNPTCNNAPMKVQLKKNSSKD